MDEEGQAAHLPDDVLAAVLRRVPPRWLAASRCVCRAWRDAVDGRRLLRADLLPLSLTGLFVHFDEHKYPEFLARPSSAAGSRAASGDLSFLPSASPHCGHIWHEACVDFDDYNIRDHCNGLLLLHNNCVVNPATRRWNTLPTCPAKDGIGPVMHRAHLVYDPMVSPHYEVFQIPTLYRYYSGDDEIYLSMEQSEWPPSLCKMYVFSSKSGCWEERCFSRQGDAAGTVSQMQAGYWRSMAVYFRGVLYVYCISNFLMRISLSNNTYSVIKPPVDLTVEDRLDINIGRSKKGLYIVASDMRWPRDKYLLRVWILNESCGQVEWMLKHDVDLKHVLQGHHFYGRDQWILEDINYNLFRSSGCCQEDSKKATTKENTEWNSDEDDNALNYGGMIEDYYSDEHHYGYSRNEDLRILGFHPYKEILFLSASERICLAYHLNGSKIEDLGNIYPKEYIYFKDLGNEQEKIQSFPYTPCWMEEFPGNN